MRVRPSQGTVTSLETPTGPELGTKTRGKSPSQTPPGLGPTARWGAGGQETIRGFSCLPGPERGKVGVQLAEPSRRKQGTIQEQAARAWVGWGVQAAVSRGYLSVLQPGGFWGSPLSASSQYPWEYHIPTAPPGWRAVPPQPSPLGGWARDFRPGGRGGV